MYKVEEFKHFEKNNLQKFIKNNWAKNHIFTKNNKIFDFQYKFNNSYTFILYKFKKKILGIQGYVNYDKYNKQINNQIFLAFWSVLKSAPIGVGLKLHKYIIEISKAKFIGIVGINKRTHKLHKWLGFKVYKMNHYVILSPFVDQFKVAKLSRKKYLINFKNNKKNKNLKFIELSETNIHQLIDDKFFNIQTPLKSKNYLINRYFKHPIYNYKIYLICEKKQPKVIFVIRNINIIKTSVIRIVDFIGENKNIKYINAFSLYLLKYFNAEYIDFYCFGISKKYFKETNFRERNKYKNLIIPNHFEPFERVNIDIYCAFKTNFKKKKIKIFKADGDGDRPSKIK